MSFAHYMKDKRFFCLLYGAIMLFVTVIMLVSDSAGDSIGNVVYVNMVCFILSKSTGMGLYLAKQLALKLGHDLSIQSEEGNMTKVTIHFPIIRNYGEWYSRK